MDGPSRNTSTESEAVSPDPTAVRRAPAKASSTDLAAELTHRPELLDDRSYIVQAAVDEFARLSADEPALTWDQYCSRFAAFGSSIADSIYRQLEVEQFLASCPWKPDAIPRAQWPQPGERRGPYEVQEQIGSGAIARVYLCSQPELGNRQVVVKFSRFSLHEADSLGRLRHHNIVPVYAYDRDPDSGLSMLCMPFLGRSTLSDYLGEQPTKFTSPARRLLHASRKGEQPSDAIDECYTAEEYSESAPTWEIVARLGQQLAAALAHSHAQDVLHGDVKPSNILLNRKGTPLLMDFNLSGAISREAAARGGTLPYMPPEQIRAILLNEKDAPRYDERSDIYSLGVVLHQALTGQLPFALAQSESNLASAPQALLALQQAGLQSLPRANEATPGWLSDIVGKCLQYLPAKRFQSAAELEHALDRGLQRAHRSAARKRKAIIAAGLVLIVAVVAAILNAPIPVAEKIEQAVAYRDEGKLLQSYRLLRKATLQAPLNIEALIELARTELAQGSFLEAAETLETLEALESSARSAAYTAYCCNLRGLHLEAIPWYQRAIERGGTTPEVLNNLAYSYGTADTELTPRKQRKKAFELLTSALELRPDSPTIQLNWIRFAVQRFVNDSQPMPHGAVDVCRQLAASESDCGPTIERVAAAFACLAVSQPEYVEEGLTHVRTAVQMGFRPSAGQLAVSGLWQPYREHSQQIEKWRQANAAKQHPERTPLLLEPVSLTKGVDAQPQVD